MSGRACEGGRRHKFFEEGVNYDTGEVIILETGVPAYGLYGFCTHAYILLCWPKGSLPTRGRRLLPRR